MKRILITGAAGFIGFHIVQKLIKKEGVQIVGIDNINDYYDVDLKYDRLRACGIDKSSIIKSGYIKSHNYTDYSFAQVDIADSIQLKKVFEEGNFDVVIHMAAQAGVRYSLTNPEAYVHSNLVGFSNVLECCRLYNIKHLVYASSSSVYGMSTKTPFTENDNVDYPVSFYAATKKSNELMAHSYSHLYRLPTTGLRLFTVYGPWGRPDMAPMIFTRSILEGKPLTLFNEGNMLRDFTYIDDVVQGILAIVGTIPNDKDKHPYYRIFNIGHSQPVNLLDFVKTLEESLGKKAVLNMQPMQPGDVKITYADTSELEKYIHYKPSVSLSEGIACFVEWYKSYFQL